MRGKIMYSKKNNYFRKMILAFLLLGCVIMVLPACKNTSQKEATTVLEMQQQTYLEQKEANNGTLASFVIRAIIFVIVGGILLGTFVGVTTLIFDVSQRLAGNGSIDSDDIRHILTVIGIILGGVAGFFLAKSLFPVKSTEYVNVETKFIFSQHNSEEIRTLIYGTELNEDASKHFLPRFPIGDEVQLTLEMNPKLIEKKIKKLSRIQKSTDLLIPVEIKILKKNGVEIKYDGGLQKDRFTCESNEDKDNYTFFIKNNEKLSQNIKFLFCSSEKGDVEIDIVYGKPEYKIVDSMCDIAQTVKFIE